MRRLFFFRASGDAMIALLPLHSQAVMSIICNCLSLLFTSAALMQH